jgi:hypothetical protein
MRVVSAVSDEYEWDVAVSFAGEDRGLVRDVVRRLQSAGVTVFYDEDHIPALWGANLYELLHSVFSRQARYVILFVSRHYVEKNWSNHERQSAQERALAQRGPYILPVRIDDSDVPGVLSTVGHIDARQVGPVGIAKATLAKLALTARVEYAGGVPDGPNDVAALLAGRPTGWEYLLYAGVLREGFAELDGKYQDHALGYAAPRGTRSVLDDDEAMRFVAGRLPALRAITASFHKVLSVAAQESAFGRPGEAADPERVIHLGRRLVDVYREFIDWAADIRAVTVANPILRRYADLTARLADPSVRALRSFVAEYLTMAEALSAGASVTTTIDVTLTVDDDVVRQQNAVLDEYCSSVGIPPPIT